MASRPWWDRAWHLSATFTFGPVEPEPEHVEVEELTPAIGFALPAPELVWDDE